MGSVPKAYFDSSRPDFFPKSSKLLPKQASRGLRWSRRCAASVPRIAERDLQALCDSPKPLLVHCGTAWSQRSQRVAAALAEWNNGELPVYALDLEASPETIGARHIKGVPTLLLLRKSQVEARADGADLEERDRGAVR